MRVNRHGAVHWVVISDTATYKYEVLLALIDLCLEGTQASGAPPAMVTTQQLANKIVEIYWPHTGVVREPGRGAPWRLDAALSTIWTLTSNPRWKSDRILL